MNIIRKIIEWIRRQYTGLKVRRYIASAVKECPESVRPGKIYVISDGPVPDTIIFKCPCGCRADIYLNLLQDTRPYWTFSWERKGRISIAPSILRKVGCRSHFFVSRGKVIWAGR
jgi:hypothetical protein